VVTSEIHFGLSKRSSETLRRQAELIMGTLDILPLEKPADRHYGEIRAELTRRGELIGQNDLLIAAHTRSLGLILVTANEKEFSRVPGLVVENWLAV
jgi:tRNA(fMet)-specific endonuclease VapC